MKKILLGILLVASLGAAQAADHQVKMLNKSADGQPMAFEPAFLKVQPGDTVTFVVASKGHNAESIQELVPEGGVTWRGKLNEEVTVTFDTPGLYVYKCAPHIAMGMVGLIQVGDSTANLETVKTTKLPPRARQRIDAALAQVAP